jgi:hypothetical protein
MDGDDANASFGLRFWFSTGLLVALVIVLSWLILRIAIV